MLLEYKSFMEGVSLLEILIWITLSALTFLPWAIGMMNIVQYMFYQDQDWIVQISYSNIRTSGHLVIEWGEVSRNLLDFTSISMENLDFIIFN